MTVGERIRNLRESKYITQSQLAKLVGLSDKSSISKIEKAGNDITLKNIERIADALNTTPSYLMGWTASPNEKQLNIYDLEGDEVTANEVRREQFENRFKFETNRYTEVLTTEESIIVECYRKLQEPEKEMIRRMLPYYEMLKERR